MFISSKLRTALVLVAVALLPTMAQALLSKSFGRAKFELAIDEDELEGFRSAVMSTDGTTIVAASSDGIVNVYEENLFKTKYRRTNRFLYSTEQNIFIYDLQLVVSSDGAVIAIAYSGQVRVFQRNSNQIYIEISSDFKGNGACTNASGHSLAMSNEGQIIAIRVFDYTECDVIRFFKKSTSNQMYEQDGLDITLQEAESDYYFDGPAVISADGATFAILLSYKDFDICTVRVFGKKHIQSNVRREGQMGCQQI